MASVYTLPAIGASLLLAVGGGIQLGESTVGLIDPIHFQGPAIHPRDRGAAIDETRLEPREPSFASLYGWDEGLTARVADCGGCAALDARDAFDEAYPPAVSIYRGLDQEWEEPVLAGGSSNGIGGPEEDARDFDLELKERVVRYAYYQVEAEAEGEDLDPEVGSEAAYWADAE
jgi:hypothetical protein